MAGIEYTNYIGTQLRPHFPLEQGERSRFAAELSDAIGKTCLAYILPRGSVVLSPARFRFTPDELPHLTLFIANPQLGIQFAKNGITPLPIPEVLRLRTQI